MTKPIKNPLKDYPLVDKSEASDLAQGADGTVFLLQELRAIRLLLEEVADKLSAED